jgi:hypothetical protein
MKFNYFKECKTLEDVKKAFRILAKLYHPDMKTGDTEKFKAINNEYEEAFEYFKNDYNNKAENKNKQNKETPEEFREIINVLIRLEGLEIEICGTWLWLSGNTYKYRDVIKSLKFKWSNSKKEWYFYNGIDEMLKIRGSRTMEEIREKYGSEIYKSNSTLNYIA